jgi:hypothetical protein
MLDHLQKTSRNISVKLVQATPAIPATLLEQLSKCNRSEEALKICRTHKPVQTDIIPATFYVDVAQNLWTRNFAESAVQVLSNLVELELDNPQLYRYVECILLFTDVVRILALTLEQFSNSGSLQMKQQCADIFAKIVQV